MFNIKKDFYKELIYNDLGQAKKYGCALTTPTTVFPDPLPEPELHKLENQYGISMNSALLEFYKQGAYLNMFWKLWDGDSRATVEQFKTDPWLQETYFDNAYPSDDLWRSIREYKLVGSIYISSMEQLLKQDSSDAYAIVLRAMDMDWKEYCLFDAQENSAAILKVENGVIVDNVWLLDFDGRELFNMEVGIEEYLHLAYKAKLFKNWQFVYVLKGEVKKSFEGYELMKRMLPKLIPHIEIDFKAFGIE